MHSAIVLTVVCMTTAVVVRHPLIWRKSEMIEMIERDEYAAFVKHRNALRSSSLITVRHWVLDYGELTYIGNVTVGTPDQQFAVILDTGSATFWVPGDICDASCGGRRKFKTNASSTFVDSNRTWVMIYGSRAAEGVLGTDTMRFGGLKERQLVVPNTTFGLAKPISEFKHVLMDGILGLGLALPLSKVVPPLINAINQRLLDSPLFTAWIQSLRTLNETSGGLFTYGAFDTANCGPVIAYEPLTSGTHYEFKITSIGMGGYTQAKVNEGVSDTGAAFICGRRIVTDLLARAAGAVVEISKLQL